MKKLLLILLCLPFIGFGQLTYVPDSTFEAYLEANGMGNNIPNDSNVFTASIDTLTSLDVAGSWSVNGGITNLTGIEDFTALTFLNCNNNQLTSLDVSTNTSLTILECSSNQLTSLDVSTNTALTSLGCGPNQLTSLDVSTNTALTTLVCGWNNLDTLDVSTNTALTILNCMDNQLDSLDVIANIALTHLYCGGNNLDSLDVSANVSLILLICDSNQLTSLDVSTNTTLTGLMCNVNQLDSLDVSTNTALTWLQCSSNNLDTLDVSQNTALTALDCRLNQLTSLDVSNNNALTALYCDSNQLTSLDVRNGNNTLLDTNFSSTNNPNLYCISVDDPVWADTNWTSANGNISYWSSFSGDCTLETLGCIDSIACNYNSSATIDDVSCVYPVIWQQADTICDDDDVIVGNSVYTTTGNYTDTLTASNGCDSIVYTNLVVNDNTDSYDTLAIIPNLNMYWNNILVNGSGDYDVTFIDGNANGCDSIANLNLTITTTGVLDITNNKSSLIKITDMLGQETPYRRNTPLFYIYDDGTVEKRIVIE